MLFPEEPITGCPQCGLEIPSDCFWRGRGHMISGPQRQVRTTILHSVCPECGTRQSIGLEGARWFRALYSWMWGIRYPSRRPPAFAPPVSDRTDRSSLRASGE